MKITICASVDFLDKIIKVRDELYKLGCDVKVPVPDEEGLMKEMSAEAKFNILKDHLDTIRHSDGILVLNFAKNGVENYIGSSTLIEIGVAFFLGKKIFILNDLPNMPLRDEVAATKPVILNGKIENIKEYL